MANRYRDCVPGTNLSPEQHAEQEAAKKPESEEKKSSKKRTMRKTE